MTSRFPTPAEMAAWPDPNYVDPSRLQTLALAVNVPLSVIVTFFITCRIYSRTVLVPAVGWDDWVMMVAAVLAVGNNIMIIVSMDSKYQMGYHLWDIRPQVLFGVMKAAQMGMAAQLLTCLAGTLSKVSILLTYLRIFPTKMNRWFCYFMFVYTVGFNFACFWLVLFQCSPAATYWQIFKYIGTAKCLNIKAIYYVYTGQNTLSDFLIFLWPAKDIASIKISLRQRITLISMFCFGVIICVAGIVRVYFTYHYLVEYDAFWHGAKLLVVCAVEISLGIACGCLPGCKPLMSRLFPRVFGPLSTRARPSDPSSKYIGSTQTDSTITPSQSQSFQMHSLASNGAGQILREQRIEITREGEKGRTEMLRRPNKVSTGGSGRERRHTRQDFDLESNDSQEFFILQGSWEEEHPNVHKAGEWN